MATMAKSAVVKARMEPGLKKKGDEILESLGLNTTTLMTLVYTQMVRQRGVPLSLKIPNEETIASFEEAKNHPESLFTYANVGEALDDVWDSK